MADGREQHVWSEHALKDHSVATAYQVNDDYILRKWVNDLKPASVLDYGCGSGLWRNVFKGYGYTGADQNAEMIKIAKQRFPNEAESFKTISWDDPEFVDSAFDMVFTSAVIQHNTHADKEKVVRGIVRLLKKGGHYMLTETTFTPENYHHAFPSRPPFHEDLSDGYSFTKTGWVKYLSGFGLSFVEFSAPGEYLFVKE